MLSNEFSNRNWIVGFRKNYKKKEIWRIKLVKVEFMQTYTSSLYRRKIIQSKFK